MEVLSAMIAGNITIDDIVLPDGTTNMGTVGGDVLYAAMGCRFWMEDVQLLTRANKPFMEIHSQMIADAGLDMRGVAIYNEDLMRSWIIYDTGQRRHFIYRTDPVIMERMSPDVVDVPHGQPPKTIFLAAMSARKQASLAQYFSDQGILVLADPYDEDVTYQREYVDKLLEYTDVFLPSAAEADRYFGDGNYRENARRFARMGPSIVVIKLGKDGCLLYQKESNSFHEIPAYDGAVVDLTGAGDAFGGGFTAGYLLTGDPLLAASYGSVSSSFAIEDFGSMHLLKGKGKEARQRLQQHLAQVRTAKKQYKDSEGIL